MNIEALNKLFKTDGPVVLPVIHVLDNEQAMRNVHAAMDGGSHGVFLINHDFPYPQFLPIVRHIREHFPDLWFGVNFLAVTGKNAFPILGQLQNEGVQINAYWADDARIDEHCPPGNQAEAEEISRIRTESGWNGLYFGGTAFKKQREVAAENYRESASAACSHMDVVTTSGIATGQAADISKIEVFRKTCGDKPLAIASGITPQNAELYAQHVDCFLVATGINIENDFYNIDPQRLELLMGITKNIRKAKHVG